MNLTKNIIPEIVGNENDTERKVPYILKPIILLGISLLIWAKLK